MLDAAIHRMKKSYLVRVEFEGDHQHAVSFVVRSGWPLRRVLADMRRQYRSYRSVSVDLVEGRFIQP